MYTKTYYVQFLSGLVQRCVPLGHDGYIANLRIYKLYVRCGTNEGSILKSDERNNPTSKPAAVFQCVLLHQHRPAVFES